MAEDESYPIVKGTYDARGLEVKDVVELEGEWVFVPSRFVCAKEDFSSFKRYERITQSWNSYEKEEKALGYATYAVKITGLSPDGIYAIKTSECFSAFTAYLSGKEFFRSGKIGKSEEEEEPYLDANLMILPSHSMRDILLVFHISNFHNNHPGFAKSIKFGYYSTLRQQKTKDAIIFIFLAGTLFLLSAFFTSLYLFYSRQKLSLYFGLICANFSVRICCYDEFLILSAFPFLDYYAVFKVGYITLTLAILLISLFVQRLFRMTKRLVLVILFIPGFVYLGINIFASPYVSSYTLIYAQLYVLLLGAYDVVLVCIKAIRRNQFAYLFLLGMFLFFIIAFRDVLVANRILGGVFMAHFGVLALLVPMSIIVLRSFKVSSDRFVVATDNIEELNTALSRFVPLEFAHFLGSSHEAIRLGDNVLKDMYVSFININICKNIKDKAGRKKSLEAYNSTLSYINPIIEYHHGFVDKFMSDGLMVLFDANAENVIRALMQIKLLLQQKNIERVLEGDEEFSFSAGIHYGTMMMGTIGEESRMDSTVISDAVNVASRLSSYALDMGISIVASQIVKDNFEDDIMEEYFIFSYKGRAKLKGRAEAIEIYEVLRE